MLGASLRAASRTGSLRNLSSPHTPVGEWRGPSEQAGVGECGFVQGGFSLFEDDAFPAEAEQKEVGKGGFVCLLVEVAEHRSCKVLSETKRVVAPLVALEAEAAEAFRSYEAVQILADGGELVVPFARKGHPGEQTAPPPAE